MMARRFWKAAVILAGGVGLMACGSSDDGPNWKYPNYTDFCEARAQSECLNSTDRCNVAEDKCRAKRASVCANEKPSSAKYRPVAAEQCLSEITKAYTDDKLTPEEMALIDAKCSLLWGGTQAKGSTCHDNYNCDVDNGMSCVKKPGQTNGKCHVPQATSPGDSCEDADAQCGDTYYCTESDQICASMVADGKDCDEKKLCKANLRCLDGTCVPKLGPGESCTADDDCLSGMSTEVLGQLECVDYLFLSRNEPICQDFK